MAVDPARELWAAWARGRLCLQGCRVCGSLQHPPAQVCSTCYATEVDLVDIDAACTLVTWSTVHRAPAPAFAADVPYTVAIVAVTGGALVQARVAAGSTTDDFEPGRAMRLTLGQVADRVVPIATPV